MSGRLKAWLLVALGTEVAWLEMGHPGKGVLLLMARQQAAAWAVDRLHTGDQPSPHRFDPTVPCGGLQCNGGHQRCSGWAEEDVTRCAKAQGWEPTGCLLPLVVQWACMGISVHEHCPALLLAPSRHGGLPQKVALYSQRPAASTPFTRLTRMKSVTLHACVLGLITPS